MVRKGMYSSYIHQGESFNIQYFSLTDYCAFNPQTGPSHYWFLQQSEDGFLTVINNIFEFSSKSCVKFFIYFWHIVMFVELAT